jgi:(2Fe-2S) ferredoxin
MAVKFKTFPWADETFDEVEVIEGTPRLYITPVGSFPSMTSVLSVLSDGGIEVWRKRVGEDEATRIVNEATDRGNALHDYNELYLNNQLQRSALAGQAKVLFNRVKRYLDQIELVIATEVPLWNVEDKYAGRVDAIVMLDGYLTILDHKNSRSPINTSMSFGRRKLFKYMLQCVGYGRALYHMKGYKPTHGCLIVGNHLTSTADKFVFELEPLEEELDLILDVYHNGGKVNNSMFFQL